MEVTMIRLENNRVTEHIKSDMVLYSAIKEMGSAPGKPAYCVEGTTPQK